MLNIYRIKLNNRKFTYMEDVFWFHRVNHSEDLDQYIMSNYANEFNIIFNLKS